MQKGNWQILACVLFVALACLSATAQLPSTPPDHVVIVIEENHSFAEIIGSSSAPYINSLAQQGALFTHSFAIEHPSEPNYLDLFSGANQGITSDACPSGPFSTDNLGAELIAAGKTFLGFSEDLPAAGSTVCTSGAYARKHNPWVDFSNVPTTSNLPFTSFPTDFTTLPTISIVVPNLNDDMHDGTIQQGDTWLQTHIDPYVQFAKTHNSLLIVTWDEDDSSQSNQIATIFFGQPVKTGQFAEMIDHFNVLRTVEDLYGLGHAGQAANVSPITDVWNTTNPDFTLSASPSSLAITQGNIGTSTITVNPLNGFSGSVNLSVSGLPSGVTASFNPTSATSASTLTLNASSTAATGTVTLTVTGVSGTLTHTTAITLTVNAAPDFSLSASPNSLTITQGNTGTSTVTVNPLNGFSGSVSLSVSGLPSGVTASFNPASATSTSTLTLTASSTAATGTATLTITGVSGTLTHTTTLSLTVTAAPAPDFSLSASPNSLTITQGNTGTSTITVSPVNGFSGSVSLSASGLPSGVTASFNPASTTSTSTLTLTAASTAATGTVTLTITGVSGTLTHTTTLSLTVNAAPVPDFSLSASPASLSITQGNAGSSTITVNPVNGFSGSVGLSVSGLPSGVTASFNPTSTTSTSTLTLTAATTAATGTVTLTITGVSGTLTHTTTLTLTVNAPAVADFSLSASPATLSIRQGASKTSTITVTPLNGFNGSVSLSASGLPSGVTASFNPASTTSTSVLTLAASTTATRGTVTVTVTGVSGSLSHTTNISLTINRHH
jgi:uncharacterized membrane protein